MALLDGGNTAPSIITSETNIHLVAALSDYLLDWWPPHGSDISLPLIQNSFSDNLPLSAITWNISSGNIAYSYFYDFYFRIHLSIYSLPLGNVLSEQQYNFYLWNSHFETKTLSNVTTDSIFDITISFPSSLPITLPSRGEIHTTLSVADVGVPTIAGNFAFDFTSEVPILYLTGQRVILWPFLPQLTFSETKQWLTDVIKARGSEQRFSLREIPRDTLSYSYIFRKEEEWSYAALLAKAVAHIANALPLWTDAVKLTNLSLDQQEIFFDTSFIELTAGSLIVFYKDYKTYEVGEVFSITSSSIILKFGLLNAYTSCWAIPVKVGYPLNGISLQRGENHSMTGNISINITNNMTLGVNSWPVFNSLPILTTPAITTGGLSDVFERDVAIFDSITGDYKQFDVELYTRRKQTIRIKTRTQEELYNIRRQFDYLQGRYQAFYLPSFHSDFTPVNNFLTAGSNSIIINYAYASKYPVSAIRIIGDTSDNKLISSRVNNFDGTETLIFSSSLASTINNIKMISVITKVRLDTDSVEFSYESIGVATVSAIVTEILS